MHILSHRGWWRSHEERNSRAALQRAFDAGFGIETDVRDCDGILVISHDMPRRHGRSPLLEFDEFLEFYSAFSARPTLALNVKSDGLVDALARSLNEYSVTNYFLFDMSVPDTRAYLSRGLNVFTRRSEYETGSRLDEQAIGLWLDAFENYFVDPELALNVIRDGKKAALVSPELHSRAHLDAWEAWRDALARLPAEDRHLVFLCTDFPADAKNFFDV